ncbi:hypothetical protein GPJ56_010185 [Histomonas meleagridis]|uniref:uncharacterized protein n=1 Tax=Histomonas meleagridis TaxID=135588 RepID=UPI00355A3342|nr:hypothetical protein GPJ56_010185 [Histomonas meleagridis]KAH0804721.1 hypothetical protein GO595_002415 [Histomonas meleagridis]
MLDEEVPKPKVVATPTLAKSSSVIIEVIVFIGIIFSALEGFGKSFPISEQKANIIQTLFVVSILLYHIANFIFEFISQEEKVQIGNYLLLNKDVHYASMILLFYMSGKCPIFLVAYYGFSFSIRFIKFIFAQLQKLKESAVQNTFVQVVTQVMAYPAVVMFPTYLEIALTIRVIFIPIFNFRFLTLLSAITYELWIALYNYRMNDSHNRFWSNLSLTLREYAAKNPEPFGMAIESFVEKFSSFVEKISAIYPSKEVKVHLQ